jgi:peptidoglycan/LPS O-acetylase OafA/YrhL
MTPTTDRFANIDALRALAALLVVIAHSAEIAIRYPAMPSALDSAIASVAHQADLGRIGVIAFFCISGYLIPMTLRGAGGGGALSFAIRRATRIYPAFWVSLLAILATLWLGFGRVFPPDQIAAHATMIPIALGNDAVMGHYWTLEVELAFYVLCAVAFLLGVTRSGAVLLALSLCFLALAVIIDPRIAPRIGLGSGATAMTRVACLGLGLMFWASALRLMREGLMPSRWRRRAVIALGGLFAGVLTLAGLAFAAMGVTGDLTRQLLGTGFGVALFLGAFLVKGAPGFALALGRWSYSIYLFHPVPLYALHAAAANGTFGTIPSGIVVPAILAVGALTIAISAIVHRLVEAPAMASGHAWAKRIEAASRRSHA